MQEGKLCGLHKKTKSFTLMSFTKKNDTNMSSDRIFTIPGYVKTTQFSLLKKDEGNGAT